MNKTDKKTRNVSRGVYRRMRSVKSYTYAPGRAKICESSTVGRGREDVITRVRVKTAQTECTFAFDTNIRIIIYTPGVPRYCVTVNNGTCYFVVAAVDPSRWDKHPTLRAVYSYGSYPTCYITARSTRPDSVSDAFESSPPFSPSGGF